MPPSFDPQLGTAYTYLTNEITMTTEREGGHAAPPRSPEGFVSIDEAALGREAQVGLVEDINVNGPVPTEPRRPEASKNIKSSLLESEETVQAFDPHDLVDWRQHHFKAPNATDARGPCPGMNTLANHGFLPRNGKNITVSIALKAARDAFNVQRDVLITAAKLAVLSSPLDDQFELTDIGLHGSFEHDASLSRFDKELGDPLAFSEQIYAVLADSNPGLDYYNITSAGQTQKIRTEQSRADNPNFRNTIKEFIFRSTESSFYLAVFGDPFTGVAPKELVNIFFREERLPLEKGWRVPKVEIYTNTLEPLIEQISEASEWQATPEQCPWVTLAPGAPEDPIKDGQVI
ncbi:hypothetical protein PQX77_000344 [Marasmius sp. AFHP31]|nr:hypothetical protein PQX77_000344 [Marasmius sp. AFHP31]